MKRPYAAIDAFNSVAVLVLKHKAIVRNSCWPLEESQCHRCGASMLRLVVQALVQMRAAAAAGAERGRVCGHT